MVRTNLGRTKPMLGMKANTESSASAKSNKLEQKMWHTHVMGNALCGDDRGDTSSCGVCCVWLAQARQQSQQRVSHIEQHDTQQGQLSPQRGVWPLACGLHLVERIDLASLVGHIVLTPVCCHFFFFFLLRFPKHSEAAQVLVDNFLPYCSPQEGQVWNWSE